MSAGVGLAEHGDAKGDGDERIDDCQAATTSSDVPRVWAFWTRNVPDRAAMTSPVRQVRVSHSKSPWESRAMTVLARAATNPKRIPARRR
jgi:hypothetical protein